MNIVIAGGSGFIGQRLSALLTAQGHNITILSRAQKKRASSLLSYQQWDPVKPENTDWHSTIDQSDVVINLVGENIGAKRWSAERKEQLRASRIDAAAALVNAIEQSDGKPSVFISASAIGIYGAQDATPVDETTPPGNDFLASICSDWESAASALKTPTVRLVLARIGLVLAANEGVFPQMVTPFKFFVGGKLGNGEQYFSWIHIDDAVQALVYLIENETLQGPVNITAPGAVNNKELTQALGAALHRPTLFTVPAFALKIILREMGAVALTGQNVVPQKLLDAGFPFSHPTLPETLQDLFG